MNKFSRIQVVRDLGLNTEDNMLVTPSTNINDLITFILQLNEVSVRVFDPIHEDRPTPHYPIVKIAELKDTLTRIFANSFYAIVAKPIDPQFAELAGCIHKSEVPFSRRSTYIIELAKGPCTTRKVTHDGIVDYRFFYPRDTIEDERIISMINEIKHVEMQNCIFEISYYSIPVGYQQSKIIIWDITGDRTKDSIDL